jgi:hypothetical protein
VNPDLSSLVIAAIGVIISLMGSAVIVAFRAGGASDRLSRMENDMARMATKEQLAGVKEDIAEIKGMFKMTLKDG